MFVFFFFYISFATFAILKKSFTKVIFYMNMICYKYICLLSPNAYIAQAVEDFSLQKYEQNYSSSEQL